MQKASWWSSLEMIFWCSPPRYNVAPLRGIILSSRSHHSQGFHSPTKWPSELARTALTNLRNLPRVDRCTTLWGWIRFPQTDRIRLELFLSALSLSCLGSKEGTCALSISHVVGRLGWLLPRGISAFSRPPLSSHQTNFIGFHKNCTDFPRIENCILKIWIHWFHDERKHCSLDWADYPILTRTIPFRGESDHHYVVMSACSLFHLSSILIGSFPIPLTMMGISTGFGHRLPTGNG